MFYSILIEPIELIVNWVYSFFINKFSFLGVIGAIYGVSMVINFLALPLYNVADSLQEKERKISKKLEYRVKRIKKGFRGDEQFMMLSEYYRQNDYHPLYVLRSSLSILIEIPFFIAAYHYLSNLESLNNTSYYFLDSLGAPDHLLSFAIGGIAVTINILPIIMTAINFISGYIYTRDATTRDKVQLYAMGIFFLVILYDSPSGLVFYWILNNIFSLCKTAALKTRHARKILLWAIALNMIVFGTLHIVMTGLSLFGVITDLIGAVLIVMSFLNLKFSKRIIKPNSGYALVFAAGTALAILCGLVIPSSVISTSPVEFSFIGAADSPIPYITHALFVYIGLFVFWPLCISRMFGARVCGYTGKLLAVLLITGLSDTFLFTGNIGNLTSQFFPENPALLTQFTFIDAIGPFVVILLSSILVTVLSVKGKTALPGFLFFAVALGELIIGLINISEIKKGYEEYALIREDVIVPESIGDDEPLNPIYTLSENGKNVVILFLDRAVGQFFPKAIEELPILQKQFEGFTYFPNTVSYSSSTVTAAPAMMGGYEYTPVRINERSDELLVDKHNESSLVMPKLFIDAGYTVSITDPPYPNYSWSGDFSAYESLGDIYVDELIGRYNDRYLSEHSMDFDKHPENRTKKEAVNYSMLQILPAVFRSGFNTLFRTQDNGLSGVDMTFISQFASLYYLNELCSIEDTGNQFIFIGNNSTHEPTHLDSTFTYPSSELDPSTLQYIPVDDYTLIHYESFIAAFRQIGEWLDFLRENGIYDNTRIVIVSDHGRNLSIDEVSDKNRSYYTPILMYKDFTSNGSLKSDDTFMTNADTLTLVTENLGLSDSNPYTGTVFFTDKADGVDVFLGDWDGEKMKKSRDTQFNLNTENFWHIAPGDISDPATWTKLNKFPER